MPAPAACRGSKQLSSRGDYTSHWLRNIADRRKSTRPTSSIARTFLAGIFAAIPLAVTIFIIWYAERHVSRCDSGGYRHSFVGIIFAIVAIYLLGLR
jgi:hypothetical protein